MTEDMKFLTAQGQNPCRSSGRRRPAFGLFFGRYSTDLLMRCQPGCAHPGTPNEDVTRWTPDRWPGSCRQATTVLKTSHDNSSAGHCDGRVERNRAGDGAAVRARRGRRFWPSDATTPRSGEVATAVEREGGRGATLAGRRHRRPDAPARIVADGAGPVRRTDDARECRRHHRLRLNRNDDRRAVGHDDGHQLARAVPADARGDAGADRTRRGRSSTCRA